MGIYYPRNLKKNFWLFTLVIILFLLSSCNAIDKNPSENEDLKERNQNLEQELAAYTDQKEELAIREAGINTRESELVTLFIDLLKKEKSLEISQIELASNQQKMLAEFKEKELKNNERNVAARNVTYITDARNARIVLGGLEKVYLDPPGLAIDARIDTGAKTSSLNAIDMIEFERDGKPYIKFSIIHPESSKKMELTRRIRGYVRIKEHQGESQRRPIVRLRIILANIDERVNFTLVDRSKFSQQVLIGRNLLKDLAVVDVSRKFTTQSARINDHK